MSGILFMPEQRGYPADYLRGRISGRKGGLITEWERLLSAADPLQGLALEEHSDEGIWRRLLREHAWMWRQMEPKLRLAFAPYFTLVELQTLVIVLRLKQAGGGERIAQLLEQSQLNPAIKARLLEEEEQEAAIARLVPLLGAIDRKFFRLDDAVREGGSSGFELRLADIWLEQQAGRRMHPVMDTFFRLTIDHRNLVAVAKHQRWGITASPAIIRGGRLLPSRLEDAAQRGDGAALGEMVRQAVGQEVSKDQIDRPEPLLLAALTREVRQMGRCDDEIGPILDYLWRRFIEARNLGVLFHGIRLERDMVRAEMVS